MSSAAVNNRSAIASAPPLALIYVIGLVIWCVLSWGEVSSVWATGSFLDPDDALKTVELRDWLAGQGWFDLTMKRLNPPFGVVMHWSHLYDVPLAILLKFFLLFTDSDHAERAMRIVFPGLLFFGQMMIVARIGRRLIQPEAAYLAVLLMAFAPPTLMLFKPGAIDHHGAQGLLLMAMLWMTIETLSARATTYAVIAGALAALSLQISVEDLPFIAVMVACFGLAYAVLGEVYSAQLRSFGLSLALFCLVIFAGTIAPEHYSRVTFDAFSIAHVVAAIIGAIGFYVLTLIRPRLSTVKTRLIALALIGGLAGALILLAFPGFIMDPLSNVAPLVHEHWLSNVVEARPLLALLPRKPMNFLYLAMPLLLGTGAAGYALVKTQGPRRGGWAIMLGFALIGDLGALWQIRVVPFALSVGIIGGAWVCMQAINYARQHDSPTLKLLPLVLALLFTNTALDMFLPEDKPAAAAESHGDPQTCFATSAFTAFRALPNGNIMTMIDPGPALLAFTDHSVVTGPFHRDIRGLTLTIETWSATPDAAQKFVKQSGATYLAFCPAAIEFNMFTRDATSLAASLRDGKVPDWLSPVALKDTPYKVFAVK